MSQPVSLPKTLGGFAERAAELLPTDVMRYFLSGAADMLTYDENIAAWQSLRLRQRVMRDVSTRDLSVELLGVRRPHPIVMAPMAWQTLAEPGGESAAARGVHAAGGIYVLSCWASQHASDVARAAPDGSRWMHVHIFSDRGLTRQLVETAEAGGYEAIVVTVDQPVAGRRDRAMGAVFDRPPSPNLAELKPGQLDATQTWGDFAELVASTTLPVLAKGVLDPEDAELAIQAGAKGLVVSNHGGRQLDTVLSTAAALPAVAERVAGRVDLLVDGGIRRGTDIVKALALGADAVLIGRPLLWGLASGGEAGAAAALELFVEEFSVALAILGVGSAAELDASALDATAGI